MTSGRVAYFLSIENLEFFWNINIYDQHKN